MGCDAMEELVCDCEEADIVGVGTVGEVRLGMTVT